MTGFLRQSTAADRRFGPFLDATDGRTVETGLTIAQADMQLSKAGAAFAQKSAVGNATHDTDGWYSTTFSVTDTNTVGDLELQVDVAGALPVWKRWTVLPGTVYDVLIAGTDNFDVNTTALLGNAVQLGIGNRLAVDAEAISGNIDTAAQVEDRITRLDVNVSTRSTLTSGEVDTTVQNILDTLDADGFNLEQSLRLLLASISRVSGADTATNTFRAADNSVDRITATVDAQGNRTNVVFNVVP